jgi:hypothetical protein
MTYRTLTSLNERRDAVRVSSGSYRPLKTFPPERHSDLVRRPGGIIKVPGRLLSAPVTSGPPSRLTRLLLNVTIGRSLGPVQVVISPEKTTGDLIKAALDIYSREKRRPLLPETDPRRFELHYSQFSLESKFFEFSISSFFNQIPNWISDNTGLFIIEQYFCNKE